MAERTNPHANLIIGAQDEASPVFDKIKASSQSMAAGVEQAAAKAAGAVGGMGDKAAPAAQKLDGITASMIRQVQRLNAELEAGGARNAAYFEKMASVKGADLSAMAPYLADLKKAEAAQRVATTGLDQMGMSAKQTTAALRQVPMQFTDIVVSLQGGQSAMQVFLQQGGQLKDMFGGAGNAARALGGYVIGLVNPFTIAAAAAGVLAVAYNQGSKEAEAFSKALILSGNASGTTSAMMADTAASISKMSGATKSAAADAVAQLAGATGIAASSFDKLATSALRFSAVSGVAVGDVVKQFSELSKDPLAATVKLNESTNFLTRSLYEQIKALDEQGNSTKAAALAQSAWADALASRSIQMEQNLGTIEKAWLSVKNGAKSAWDAMLNIGRDTTPTQQLEKIQQQIQEKERLIANGGFASNEGGAAFGTANQATLARLNAEVTALRAKAAALAGVADAAKYSAEQEAKAASTQRASAEWDKESLKYLDKKTQMNRELNKVVNEGIAAGKDSIEIVKRIEAIRANYAETAAKAPTVKSDAWATEVAKSYTQAMAELEKVQAGASATAEGLSKSQTALRKVMESPAWAAFGRQQREQVIYQASIAQAAEDEAEAHKKVTQIIKEAHAEYVKSLEVQTKITDGVTQHVQRLHDEAEATALAAAKNISLAQAVELVTIKRLEEKQVQAMGNEDMVAAIQKEIDARKLLASEISSKDTRDKASAEWKSFWSDMDSTARRVWTDIWHGGQDAFTKVRDTVKALLLDLTYMMAKKWVIGVAASVTGGTATAGGVSGGTGLSLSNMASTAKSVWSTATGPESWFTNFGGAAGNSVADIGTSLVEKGFTTFGTELEAWGLAMKANSAAINAAGDAAGYFGAAVYASQGKWGAAAGSAIGTYFAGPIGSAIGGYIGGLVDTWAGNTGARPSTEGGFASAGGPVGSANGRTFVDGVYGGQIDGAAKKVVEDVTTLYSTVSKSLGAKAGILTAQAFVGINNGDNGDPNALHMDAQLGGKWLYNRWTDNGGSLSAGKTSDDMTAAISLSAKKIVIEALRSTDLGVALNDYLSTVITQGKTLAEIDSTLKDVTGFVNFHDAVKALPFDYLTTASVAAAKALQESAGSFDNFKTLLGNYVDLFYSDAEKTSFATKALQNGFAALGIPMGAIDKNTRDWYKSQVALAGAQDLSVKANADQYNSLLGLASAVNALAPAAETAAAALEASADKLRTTVLDNLKGTTSSISAILKDGMLGKISKDDVGGQVADAIANGLQDAMAQTVADQIANAFTTSIITPIIDAVLQGAAISSAVSQAAIDGAVASAQKQMDALTALFNDPKFQSLLSGIRTSLGGSASASVNSGAAQGNNGANFGGSATVGTATATAVAALTYAQQHAAIEAANAFAIANPIAATGSAGQVMYRGQQAFHLSAEDAASQLQSLQTALESLSATTQTEAERRAAERYVVDDSNLALYDRVQILRDEAAATALATTALSTRQSWQDKLDVLTGKTTDVALQQARDLAAVEAHAAEARAQLVYVTDAAARAALEQSIATDEATKAIIGQVYAQQSATAAAAEAAAAAKAAEQAASATAAARMSWQEKLDVATGKTTDRAVQLAHDLAGTTDATTQALIRQYYAQLDLADAAAAATAAAESAAQAAQAQAEAAAQAAQEQARKDIETQKSRLGLQSSIYALTGEKTAAALVLAQQRAMDLAALDPSLRELQSTLWGLQDEAELISARADTAGKYQSVVSAEKQAREGITSGYLQAVDALKAINDTAADSLRDLAKNLRDFVQGIDATDAGGLGPSERLAAAQANFAIVKAQAMAGDTGAQGKLTGLASSVLDLSLQTAASKADYLRTVGLLKADLATVAELADAKAGAQTPAEDELLAAQKEVAKWSAAAAESGAATAQAVTDYAEEWRKANADLTTANKALSDVGISALALNVKQPITELIESISVLSKQMALTASTNPKSTTLAELTGAIPSGAVAGGAGSLGVGGASQYAHLGKSVGAMWGLGQTMVTPWGASMFANADIQADPVLRAAFGMGVGNATGQTAQLYAAMQADNPAYNDLGTWLDQNVDKTTGLVAIGPGAYIQLFDPSKLTAFDVGTNFVPRDMLAQVHRGEMIVPAAYNPATSGVGSADMVAEIRALRAEVAELRKANTAENAAIAGTSLRTAKVLERATPDGDAIAIRTAEAIA